MLTYYYRALIISGGRDHLPCCYKRGVSAECQLLCQGVQYTTDHSIYTKCLAYIGNIMLCLEEGSTSLPGKLKIKPRTHSLRLSTDKGRRKF